MNNKELNTLKLQQRKLYLLLEDLNNLSVHYYSYRFGQQDGKNKHYLYVSIDRTQRILFRYYDTINEVIQLVQNLIKYRTLEYETYNEELAK